MPEDKFIRVYVDLLIVHDSSSVQNLSLDSLKQALFKKYETTEEHYQNTIDYYNETPQKWEAFFDKATAYVEELESKQVKWAVILQQRSWSSHKKYLKVIYFCIL